MSDSAEGKAYRGVPLDVVLAEARKLKELYDAHTDFTQAEFGHKFGLGTQGAVWQYLNGKRPLNVEAADAFARGLHVPIESFSPRIVQEIRDTHRRLAELLDAGVAEMRDRGAQEIIDAYERDARERPVEITEIETPNRIPLISWVAAGQWSEAADPYAPGAAEDWIMVPGNTATGAIALRVRGDSMEPKFPDGCVIIVDTHRKPKSGQFVVVRNNDWNEATFKQFVQDGAIKLLKPLNPRYPVQQLGAGTVLVGVIVRKFIDEPV